MGRNRRTRLLWAQRNVFDRQLQHLVPDPSCAIPHQHPHPRVDQSTSVHATMSYFVTCWDLPQSADGVHNSDGLSALSPFSQAWTPSGTACLPCARGPPQRCTLVDIGYRALTDDTGVHSIASLESATHVLVSQKFAPDLISSILAQCSTQLCSLVIILPPEDLEYLGDILPGSDGLRSMSLMSTAAVIPLPAGLTRHLITLTTLLLSNVIPTSIWLDTLSGLTTLSLFTNAQPPATFDYEYRISDLFQLLLHTPQLEHLRLSGFGPTVYDVTPNWIVPLEFLETLHLHHCRLQEEILHHLSISLEMREISIHKRVRSVPPSVGAVLCITASKWEFIPSSVDFYQEGVNCCRLRFLGTRLLRGSRDGLVDSPVLSLEISVTNTAQLPDPTFPGQCLRSFRSLSTASVQRLAISSYQWPLGRAENPACDLLKSLPALKKLLLRGATKARSTKR